MRTARVVVVIAVASTLALALWTRGMGFRTRGLPSWMEESVMRAARNWATPSAIRGALNPTPATAAVVHGAMEHWADHCAVCHGNDGSGQTPMGRSFYPPAPDMRAAHTQGMTDGALFYVIEQGIPLTGMPAWGNGTPEGVEASWALVRFIRHLPTITDDEVAGMEVLNPKSQAEREQDKRIDDFLNGQDTH